MKVITYGTLTLKQYKQEKLKMLQTEFKIRLKCFEVEHLKSLTSEIQVDNYIRALFKKYL